MVALLYLVAITLIVVQIARIVGREEPKPRTVQRERITDSWISNLYPNFYVGEHRDEPTPRLFHLPWDRFHRHEALTDAERDALVVDVAFDLEFRARRVLADRQFKGILRGRATVVWGRDRARDLEALLAVHRPGADAQAHLDRALAWWAAARAIGMRIYEWDEDGYDSVDDAFAGLPRHAKAKVDVDPAAHGVVVTPYEVELVPDPLPFPTAEVVRIALLIAAMIAASFVLPRSTASSRSTPRLDCDQQIEIVRRAAGREEDPERAALVAAVLADVDAGAYQRAHERWRDAPGTPSPGSMLEIHLFVLTTCPARPAAASP